MNKKSSTYRSGIQTPHQLGKNAAGGFHCEKCDQDWVHEPKSKCPGVKVFGWGKWPATLLTARQLQELGYDATILGNPRGCASFNAQKQWLWLYAPPARPEDIVDAETGESLLEKMLNAPLPSLIELGEARGLVLEDPEIKKSRDRIVERFRAVSGQNLGAFAKDFKLGQIKRDLIKKLLADLAVNGSHDDCTRAKYEKERAS